MLAKCVALAATHTPIATTTRHASHDLLFLDDPTPLHALDFIRAPHLNPFLSTLARLPIAFAYTLASGMMSAIRLSTGMEGPVRPKPLGPGVHLA